MKIRDITKTDTSTLIKEISGRVGKDYHTHKRTLGFGCGESEIVFHSATEDRLFYGQGAVANEIDNGSICISFHKEISTEDILVEIERRVNENIVGSIFLEWGNGVVIRDSSGLFVASGYEHVSEIINQGAVNQHRNACVTA